MRLILFGEPGAGKGTLSTMLSHRLGIKHISTGNYFRSEMARGTELGKLAASYINKGHFVPDNITISIVKKIFEDSHDGNHGFVLDGFPRTVPQAEALDKMLYDHHWKLDGIVRINVNRDELINRLTSRRVCRSCATVYNLVNYPPKKSGVCDKCGGELYQREDDEEDKVKIRLGVYDKQTQPILDYYQKKGVLETIETTGDNAEQSYAKLMRALGKE